MFRPILRIRDLQSYIFIIKKSFRLIIKNQKTRTFKLINFISWTQILLFQPCEAKMFCKIFNNATLDVSETYSNIFSNKRLTKPSLVIRVGPGTNPKPKYGSHWTESLIATWRKKKKEKRNRTKRWLVVPRVKRNGTQKLTRGTTSNKISIYFQYSKQKLDLKFQSFFRNKVIYMLKI